MEKVTGRSDDMLILRGVNVFPTQIEEVLLARPWCGGHFQIVLTRDGRMDEMAVHAEARPGYWDGAGLMAEAAEVVAIVKNTVGVTTRVIVEPPGTLERSLGKVKRVIDRRPRG
jgi:phenylacetate-CoA ligase